MQRKKTGLKSQAERILQKFGGARNLSRILNEIGRPKTPSTIYKWTYPREREGTDGLIPHLSIVDVIAAARADGILLTAEDFDPRPR